VQCDQSPPEEEDERADESPTSLSDELAYLWQYKPCFYLYNEFPNYIWSIYYPPIATLEISTVDYSRLTSFLKVDHSFLSPWHWDPHPIDEKDSSTDEGDDQERMNFQPGSFFSHPII